MTDNKNSIGWSFSDNKIEISIEITRDKLEPLINDFKSMIDYELSTHDLEQEAGLGLLKIHYSPIYVLDFGGGIKLHIDVSTFNDAAEVTSLDPDCIITIRPRLSLITSIIENLKLLKDSNGRHFEIGLKDNSKGYPKSLVFTIIED
jgi:hypothetical protein